MARRAVAGFPLMPRRAPVPLPAPGAEREAVPVHVFPPRPYYISADPHWADQHVEYRDATALLRGPGSRGRHQITWDRTIGRSERTSIDARPDLGSS